MERSSSCLTPFLLLQVLHPLQQRFLNLINQENFAQISQEEAVKQEIVATLEALCGIAEATQIDNVASLFSFLMDFLSSCIGLMEVRSERRAARLLDRWKGNAADDLWFCSGLQQHARNDQPHHRGLRGGGSQADLLPGRGERHSVASVLVPVPDAERLLLLLRPSP